MHSQMQWPPYLHGCSIAAYTLQCMIGPPGFCVISLVSTAGQVAAVANQVIDAYEPGMMDACEYSIT
jgi:hypothetical protein